MPLGQSGAGTPAKVVSCPGAQACRLAVTQSRGLARLLEPAFFARVDPARAREALADLAAVSGETLAPEDLVDLGDPELSAPVEGERAA